MALIIKANGEQTQIEPRDGRYFSLEECQAIVGGYIEIVPLPQLSPTDIRDRMMIVNEERKLKNLPLNKAATILYSYDVILGDVLICDASQMEE